MHGLSSVDLVFNNTNCLETSFSNAVFKIFIKPSGGQG